MSEGVRILGVTTLPTKVEQLSKYEFKIILTQGLNRQIRRMCEAFPGLRYLSFTKNSNYEYSLRKTANRSMALFIEKKRKINCLMN